MTIVVAVGFIEVGAFLAVSVVGIRSLLIRRDRQRQRINTPTPAPGWSMSAPTQSHQCPVPAEDHSSNAFDVKHG